MDIARRTDGYVRYSLRDWQGKETFWEIGGAEWVGEEQGLAKGRIGLEVWFIPESIYKKIMEGPIPELWLYKQWSLTNARTGDDVTKTYRLGKVDDFYIFTQQDFSGENEDSRCFNISISYKGC